MMSLAYSHSPAFGTSMWTGSPLMQSSLISFDMDTQIWSNHTYDDTPRAAGTLQYIPASASGMLVYFGGVEMDSTGAVQQVGGLHTADDV